jgi:hypothetical protein
LYQHLYGHQQFQPRIKRQGFGPYTGVGEVSGGARRAVRIEVVVRDPR